MVFSAAITRVSFDRVDNAVLNPLNDASMIGFAVLRAGAALVTTVDVHTKERKANGCGYKTEHVGLGLRGISKEQLEKGDKVIVKNANMYGM